MNRIAFITDLHILQNGDGSVSRTEQNFYDLVEALRGWSLDHIICGGDLSDKEPMIEDCLLVRKYLNDLDCPYSVVKGNHDSTDLFTKVFGYEAFGTDIYYRKRIGEHDYIFLDTGRGSMSTTQYKWLAEQLEWIDHPQIIMHYPPFHSGVVYMDTKHPFEEVEKMLEVLTAVKKPINIFCGHCHTERTIHYQNLSVFITPSCKMQVDEQETNFKPYHDKVGYRIIEWDKQALRTFVKYLF